MPTLVHFELPADDIERAKKFYSNLFGWKIEKWEGLANSMEYWNTGLLTLQIIKAIKV